MFTVGGGKPSLRAFSSPIHTGIFVTYTLTVKNNGPNIATNIALTDILPDSQYATLLSVTPGKGGACTKSPLSIYRLGALNPGASTTVTVKVKCQGKGRNHQHRQRQRRPHRTDARRQRQPTGAIAYPRIAP